MTKKMFYGILTVVLAAVIVIACGIGSSWFKNGDIRTWFNNWGQTKQDEVNNNKPDDDGGNNVIVNGEPGGLQVMETESNGGVSLLSAKIPEMDYEANGISEQADSAYTISITTTPVLVTDFFEWTISDNNAVTMTLGSNNRSVTIVCNEAFSAPITITVKSTSNPSLTASCQLDYLKRISNLSLDMPTIKLNDTLTEYDVNLNYTLSAGTITPEISCTDGTIVCIGLIYNNARAYLPSGSISYMEANAKGTVDITNGKFSLIMSETQQSSFYQLVKGATTPDMLQAYFVSFVSYANGGSPDFEISVDYSISAAGKGTYESGTLTGTGNFDVSDLVKPATNMNISHTTIIL